MLLVHILLWKQIKIQNIKYWIENLHFEIMQFNEHFQAEVLETHPPKPPAVYLLNSFPDKI